MLVTDRRTDDVPIIIVFRVYPCFQVINFVSSSENSNYKK